MCSVPYICTLYMYVVCVRCMCMCISNNFTSSFPPLLQPDDSTAVSSFSKAELFIQTFATNSTLDDTGHIPPTPPPSDYFMPETWFCSMPQKLNFYNYLLDITFQRPDPQYIYDSGSVHRGAKLSMTAPSEPSVRGRGARVS